MLVPFLGLDKHWIKLLVHCLLLTYLNYTSKVILLKPTSRNSNELMGLKISIISFQPHYSRDVCFRFRFSLRAPPGRRQHRLRRTQVKGAILWSKILN